MATMASIERTSMTSRAAGKMRLGRDVEAEIAAAPAGCRPPSAISASRRACWRYPGFDYYVFYGVLVPTGTPDAIVGNLNSEIDRALTASDIRKSLAERGVDVRAGTAKQFDAFLAKERAKWSVAVRESGATVD